MTGSAPLGSGPVHGFVATWEFECCGTPHRVGDEVNAQRYEWSDETSGEGPWARLASSPVAWAVGHHDVGPAPVASVPATILRVWEAWAPLASMPGGGFCADPNGGRLVEAGRTAPHSGSPDAVLSPRPPGIPQDEEHWGWILQLQLHDDRSDA